jgi:predicted secreted Zn-dependent protease
VRSRAAAILLLVTACGPKIHTTIPLPAGVVIVGSTQRYPVVGATASQILRSMRERAPRPGGGSFLGYHSYNLRWAYRMASAGLSCHFTDVRVEIHTLIQLPEWQRPPDAPAALIEQWNSFSAALDEHERGHERIAVEGAGEMARMLRDVQDMTCSALETEANRRARALSESVRQREVQFDAETQHGVRTGARWPPGLARDSTRR